MSPIELIECDPGDPAALFCLDRYYAELSARFNNGFDVSRSRDPPAAQLVRPLGAFVVALCEVVPVGCIALKGKGVLIVSL